MRAAKLYRTGRLDEAIEAIGLELREAPGDIRRRTFLFELLCLAGNYDRAEKQLDILARSGAEAEAGTLLYRGALHAERTRLEQFDTGLPAAETGPAAVSGSLNGRAFHDLRDADPRVGARLEVFAGGQYLWIPLQHVASIRMEPPRRVRDLVWAPATVRVGPGMRGVELGEVLLPALTPYAWAHHDPLVRLGRVTEWDRLGDGREAPVGQKLLLVDDEAFPILELRELEVASAPATASAP
ncbi:MAG TPA: type VI secretion system accessory protein TagJ [Gemmatimonadales bacterium]|jgi:Protein of avirulence locus involved in temperature-dependent protein secretion